MAKLINGDNVQNIITDGDVIVTSPSKIGKTLDEVLVEQQSDIDRLKSNVKYIYAYGGVGGSGSGGSGNGTTVNPMVNISLSGYSVSNGGEAIVLEQKGVHQLYVKINNPGGKTYYMGYSTSGVVTDAMMRYKIDGDNRYGITVDVTLNENGTLFIGVIDDEGNLIGNFSQKYIVEAETFNVTLNYTDATGKPGIYSKEPYECFVDDPVRNDRYFKIDYSIFLLDYEDVRVKCELSGVGVDVLIYEASSLPGSGIIEIPMSDIKINGGEILQDKNMGIYNLQTTLSYKITGREVERKIDIKISVIPSGLYINVRTNNDVLYDDVESLLNDMVQGVDGIPYKCISQGSSLMMYCKVFEGSKIGDGNVYRITVTAFDAVDTSDSEIEDWSDIGIYETEDLTEQIESNIGISVTFSTEGIKRIKISTKNEMGEPKDFYKYVYVKKLESYCDWYNSKRYSYLGESYFKANQGDDTYFSFPKLPSGNGILSLTKSSNLITLTNDDLISPKESLFCTVISLGIQVSNINSENAKIVDVYTTALKTAPTYSLRTNSLFADDGSNKIAIPTEILNKNENSKYHLIQIIRNLAGFENGTTPVYEDSLYIDGLLESSAASTVSWSSEVSKIILQNINICYNLINIQYFSPTHKEGNENYNFNPDGYAYQYWLAYKEKYVNSSFNENRLTEGERDFIGGYMDRIFFDGTNVVVDTGIIMDIAKHSALPTVVFSYNCETGDKKVLDEFMNLMWAGRTNGDTSFNSRMIDLYWIPGKSVGNFKDYKVEIPSGLTDKDGGDITGNWEIDLQGTSTMRNRIKNYSLRINSQSTGGNNKILFSPNFNVKDPKTFLPDVEWTIKADIADSAHANNTSIGKFVNEVCTKIDTDIPDSTDTAKAFIKNALEGIPVLLYFMCTGLDTEGNTITKIYYFGVYNFNLGRNSYYNLGYNGGKVGEENGRYRSDHMRVFNNILEENGSKYFKDKVFTFAVGECMLSDDIVIGEIQENSPEFDFHQYDPTLLFKNSDSETINCMFGSESKITGKFDWAKIALTNLVKGVAKAGKFCFMQSGRVEDFVTSREFGYDENGNFNYGDICFNRYAEGKIPDPIWQKTYENTKIKWKEDHECDNDKVNMVDLKKLIIPYEDGETFNNPLLDYNSAAEYYTICMAFGMVDSVLKNMNLKNFRNVSKGPKFYCAFYDMDCALEEANDGKENITYLAATDYWYSPVLDAKKNKIGVVERKNDFWNDEVGSGFDFTSSYLFAVVKYAKSIFDALPAGEEKYEGVLNNYPQNFWAKLRQDGGPLQNADHFMENYFKSGITSTFEYLASLNYRVKYLYHGETIDSKGKPVVKYLANGSAFNGSRRIKAKQWLSKRLQFLDFMMNVNSLTIPIHDKSMLRIPSPDSNLKSNLMSNDDITILHSAFNDDTHAAALSNMAGEVEIYAPIHTPFIFMKGGNNVSSYLLPGGIDKPNSITLTTTAAETTRFYGSGAFTSVNKVEYMLTNYNGIQSDNLEKITYGGDTTKGNGGGNFYVNAKSVTEIKLDIPTMGGALSIDRGCISLEKLNIANSGFHGSFDGFVNLQEVNISGVSTKNSISVSGSDYLTGERFYISGADEDHKTAIGSLNITGVTGNFNCENTNIEKISIENATNRDDSDFDPDMLSEFNIYGDNVLKELNLKGFRKVSITSCNSLEKLIIDDALEELYINLEKFKDENTSLLVNIPFIEEPTVEQKGIFDFTNYPNLKRVTLMNCDHLVHVKLPDQDIETDGMGNNPNLRWIDTGRLPAFRDDKEYKGKEGTEYEGETFPKYGNAPKLILCSDSTFYNCPNYSMLRSDWNKGAEIASDNEAGNYKAYTNIIVSNKCTSLSNTFGLSKPSPEKEDNGEIDDIFRMGEAIRFIVNCVPDDVKKQIESLSGCFKGRTNIEYKITQANKEKQGTIKYHPTLTKYESLKDISSMYENTNVLFVTKDLLDLPFEKNTPDNDLNWDTFIKQMTKMSISNDALYNISYRLRSYSYISFTIYEYDSIEEYSYVLSGGTKDNPKPFKICDFFYPFDDGKKTYTEDDGCVFTEDVIPYNSIRVLESLNFGDQFIDFRGMFQLFPNVETMATFLNGNLNKYNIQGLLKPCKNIKSIVYCFNDNGINNSDITNPQIIDLYNFFNWDGNTTDILQLFEGPSNTGTGSLLNGFVVKKYITYDNFKKILEKIETYSKLTNLTNIFSYCTITNYPKDDNEIKFKNTLNKIINISNLFDSCTSDYKPLEGMEEGEKGRYTGGVLNIGRSFFEKLPGVKAAQKTFANTYLSSPLTYDYFCKRGKSFKTKQVLLSKNTEDIATLYEYQYSQDIINLTECFCNTKFVNYKNWFDPDDESNSTIEIVRNYIEKTDGTKISERGFVYYTYNDDVYEEHVLDNDIIDDCLDNYTDFVSKNEIINKNGTNVWYNHDLYQDLYYYNNMKSGKPIGALNSDRNENCIDTIQKTYCCIPPDFLYGCGTGVKIDSIFADSNIIGVIPRNLTKNVKKQSISNIFRNVNIMPNLEYYYDVNCGLDTILDSITETVEIDSETISDEYKVVFRDNYGILRKRKPIASDRNCGQFVYVPANFTTCNSLMNAFNFRYNLPKHWLLGSESDIAKSLYYKSTQDFNDAISDGKIDATKLMYRSQYYFITDKSVKWDNIYDARYVFISAAQDIDFGNKFTMGRVRDYCDLDDFTSIEKDKNAWTELLSVSNANNWTINNIENFYIDLNLCGKKNDYNMIEDHGCPIIIKNRTVYLDYFLQDVLTVFLNGRVFSDTFMVQDLTSSNHKSSSSSMVIGYYGFGKNIILPRFNGSPLDDEFVFIPVDDEIIYYDFMVNNESSSLSYYRQYFAPEGTLSNKKDLFETKYNKYTFK